MAALQHTVSDSLLQLPASTRKIKQCMLSKMAHDINLTHRKTLSVRTVHAGTLWESCGVKAAARINTSQQQLHHQPWPAFFPPIHGLQRMCTLVHSMQALWRILVLHSINAMASQWKPS